MLLFFVKVRGQLSLNNCFLTGVYSKSSLPLVLRCLSPGLPCPNKATQTLMMSHVTACGFEGRESHATARANAGPQTATDKFYTVCEPMPAHRLQCRFTDCESNCQSLGVSGIENRLGCAAPSAGGTGPGHPSAPVIFWACWLFSD